MSQKFAEADDFNAPKIKKRRSSKRKKKRYEFKKTEATKNQKLVEEKVETAKAAKSKLVEEKVETAKAAKSKLVEEKVETAKAVKPNLVEKKVETPKVAKTNLAEAKVEKLTVEEKGNKDELLGLKMIFLQDRVKHLEKLIKEKDRTVKVLKEKNKETQTENDDLLQIGNQLKNELVIQVNAREEELKQFVELQRLNVGLEKKHERLEKQYKVLERKYNGLSNSKLGRLTLRYWRFMNRLKGGQK
ncbi:hypothetical protein [Bacillus cytotoxicus]|uniref:hypothetical protein n=1 Tax=Bacillus cytotoxicus TaxID=580165 RepID=UPI00244C7535|nr:hypothetical protein [Bacillus cytotoxicus]MDH2887879.1 hypothetical protein [Bacillus cytotoxicus]